MAVGNEPDLYGMNLHVPLTGIADEDNAQYAHECRCGLPVFEHVNGGACGRYRGKGTVRYPRAVSPRIYQHVIPDTDAAPKEPALGTVH